MDFEPSNVSNSIEIAWSRSVCSVMILVQLPGFLPVMSFKTDVLQGSHRRRGPQLQIFVDSLVSYLSCVISIKICTSGDV